MQKGCGVLCQVKASDTKTYHLLNMVAVEKGVRDLLVDQVWEKCLRRLYVEILEENVRGSSKEMRQMSEWEFIKYYVDNVEYNVD